MARYRLDQGTDNPPDSRNLFGNRALLEGFAYLLEALQAFLDRLLLDDVDQRQLVNWPQFFRQQLGRLVLIVIERLFLGAFLVHRQIRQEQEFLGKQVLVSYRTDIIQQRQNCDWNVSIPRLDVLQVVRQLQHRAQQHFQRLLSVLLLVFGDEIDQRDHLLGQHRGAVLLDHHQHALDQAQPLLDPLQQVFVVFLDIQLQIGLDLGQVVIDGFLDPSKRAVFDRGFLGIHRMT